MGYFFEILSKCARMPSGTTSLPMPSPGITAISYLFFAIFMILWSGVCLCAGQ